MKRAVLEALLVGAAGLALGFAANAVSPRGLKLGSNPFHLGTQHRAVVTNPVPAADGSAARTLADSLAARIKAEGLQAAGSNEVIRLFHDAAREQEQILFIDARDPEHYRQGHIPGAYEFYFLKPEAYLATVGPLCLAARRIVVYCNGGDCEESLQAARTLRDLQVPKENLLVYVGGITEWSTNGLPIEVGERLSGPASPARP